MQDKIPNNSIDLIYLDPPFNSNRNYNRIYSTHTGQPVPEEAIAFCDTWELTQDKEDDIRAFNETLITDGNEQFASFWTAWVNALRHQNPKILSYLVFMAQRLWVMRSKLKDTGSLFLHCDPTASHYIKIILDGIFGHDNFRNEIIWCYSNSGRPKKGFPKKHDVIFFYSKKDFYWNPNFSIPYSIDYINSHFKDIDENNKQCRKRFDVGKWRTYYPEKGMIPNDWWSDIPSLNSMAIERLGYPTQKPVALLDRIIKSCCLKMELY